MRILVAEDDPSLAEGLMRSLRQAGNAVTARKTVTRPTPALEANEFDVLILDLGCQKSGLEVLNACARAVQGTSADPVPRATACTTASPAWMRAPTTTWPSLPSCRATRASSALTCRGMAAAWRSSAMSAHLRPGRPHRCVNGNRSTFRARGRPARDIPARAGAWCRGPAGQPLCEWGEEFRVTRSRYMSTRAQDLSRAACASYRAGLGYSLERPEST